MYAYHTHNTYIHTYIDKLRRYPIDYPKALNAFTQAARTGHAEALTSLGAMFYSKFYK